MREYFIRANSFAAPFFSDESSSYVEADDPRSALETFAAAYTHPCGLYAAVCYASADAYYKKQPALAKWFCNHEIEKQRLTKDTPAYSYFGHGPGDFELNHERHTVADPKAGRVVVAEGDGP
jgi:hypothetical protein